MIANRTRPTFPARARLTAALLAGSLLASLEFLRAAEAGPASAVFGLVEASSRRGWREPDQTRRGDTWLSERLIFRDDTTGAILWRMTCDPAIDVLAYYDIPAWNADGSLMLFNSERSHGKQWIMQADGANLRPWSAPANFEQHPPRRDPGHVPQSTFFYWSVIDPLRIFYSYSSGGKTHVVAFNPLTAAETVVASADGELGPMMPPHPTEKWFLFGRKSQRSVGTTVSTLGVDGSLAQFDSEKPIHRLRFTTSPDGRVFYNQDGPRTSWTCLPDGSSRSEIIYQKRGTRLGHPGWRAAGSEMTGYSRGKLLGFSYDGRQQRVIAELEADSGHGTTSLDDLWLFSDSPTNRIDVVKLDGSGTVVRIANSHTSFLGHFNTWHPQSHSTHAHPVSSPDGTKVLFNSDGLSDYTDIYVAVVRPPDPPLHLQARSAGGHTVLSWQKPFRSHEVRGYHIYRTSESGLNYERLTASPLAGLSWTLPAESRESWFVVTAVEHSGLEGIPSNETWGGARPASGPVRLTCEAELGTPSSGVREAIDPRDASQGWFMQFPPPGLPVGRLAVKIATSKRADYVMWARIRGTGAARVDVGGARSAVKSTAADWTWKRFDRPLTLSAGELSLVLAGGGVGLDRIFLTDDPRFTPEGRLPLDSTPPAIPREVATSAVSPNAVRLTWTPTTGPQSDDIDHYNVYGSSQAAFEPGQASFVRSPSECEMVDWGLPLNSVRYYRVTAVDRFGNESAPTSAVEGRVRRFMPVAIALAAETAKADGMKSEPVSPPARTGITTCLSAVAGKGSASWTFDVPRDGEYAIWILSTHHADAPPATLGVDVDGGAISSQVRARGPWEAWNWTPVGNQATGTPQRFRLRSGSHAIRLDARSATANVAQIMITDDPSWDPIEGMSKFAGRP